MFLNQDLETPIYKATYKNHMEVVQVLLVAGAEVNIKNKYTQTPIYCAALYGNGEIVMYLLEAGANVNMKDKVCAG